MEELKLKVLEKIDVNLSDLGLGNGLLEMTLKAQENINKLVFIKIKLMILKDTIMKVKRQPQIGKNNK